MEADFIEFVRNDLAQRGRIKQVAEATGIKEKTLRNIRYGVTKNPSWDVVKPLQAYYDIQRAVRSLEQQAAAGQSRRQMG